MNTRYSISAETSAMTKPPRLDMPAFVAGIVSSACVLFMYMSAVEYSLFSIFMLFLLLFGLSVSWLTYQGIVAKWVRNLILGLFLLLSIYSLFTVEQLTDMLANPQSVLPGDPRVAGFLVWLIVLCSFNIISTSAVLFICVPSISLIALVSTIGLNINSIPYFAVFLCASAFVMIRESIYSRDGRYVQRRKAVFTIVKTHMALAGSIAIITLLIGGIIGSFLFGLIDRVFISRWMMMYRMNIMGHNMMSRDYTRVMSGPGPQSNLEIMTIECEQPFLWRSQTFNSYTGNGWTSSFTGSMTRLIKPTEDGNNPTGSDQTARFHKTSFDIPYIEGRRSIKKVRQEITLINGMLDEVVAAAEPRKVVFYRDVRFLRKDFLEGSLQTMPPYQAGARYIVESEVGTTASKELSSSTTDYPDFVRKHYLGVPESCWEIKKLTKEVTKGKNNPYAKVLAVQSYLMTNFKYDLNAPACPSGEDAVCYFLLESEKGYCDIFATSMVVMCRQAGIPARYVTGFATGEYNPDDGKYHLRVKDRHAWAEVYFTDYGWITFDPTPAGSDISTVERVGLIIDSMKGFLAREWKYILIGLIIAFLIAYVLKTEVWDRFRSKWQPLTKYPVYIRPVVENYRMMCYIMNRYGFSRLPSVTPSEYAAVLSEIVPGISEYVRLITVDFEEARYARRVLSQDRLDAENHALRELKTALKKTKRQSMMPEGASAK